MLVLWVLPTFALSGPTAANAAPRTFPFSSAAWDVEVPATTTSAFGEVILNVPVVWKVNRLVITVQVPVTTPPGAELHVVPRVRVEGTGRLREDIGGKLACVDIERIGLTVYLKCAVGDLPEPKVSDEAPLLRSVIKRS